jgi:hypothetical protein
MAARTCPNCLTVMSAGRVVAYSDDLVCAGCQKPLEISALSRNLAITVAIVASAGVWWMNSHGPQGQSSLGWVLPVAYAVIAFGTVAALLLMVMADLRIKDSDEIPRVLLSSAEPESHGSHH